jgi:hypothetical protein
MGSAKEVRSMSAIVRSQETLTFIVRLWRETDSSGHERWRGRVEHVGSQEVEYVEDVAGVARFIEGWTSGEGALAGPCQLLP